MPTPPNPMSEVSVTGIGLPFVSRIRREPFKNSLRLEPDTSRRSTPERTKMRSLANLVRVPLMFFQISAK